MDEIKEKLDALKEQEVKLEELKESMDKASNEYDNILFSGNENAGFKGDLKDITSSVNKKEETAKAYAAKQEENKKMAEEINREMSEATGKYEKDIAAVKEKTDKIAQEITAKEAELAEIEKSEEYSVAGPTQARAKVMTLEKEIDTLKRNKERMKNGLDYIKKSLETIKEEREKLVKNYDLKDVTINVKTEQEETEQENEVKADEELKKAKKRVKELDEEIAKKEAEVTELGKKIEEYLAAIREIEAEYNTLKDSNDEKDKARIEELKTLLNEKINEKNEASKKLIDTRAEINKLTAEREALVNKYGDELLEQAQPVSAVARENEATSEAVPNVSAENAKITEEQEIEKITPKQEGKALLKKIKSGKPLAKEDVENITEILSNPENYARYGLSTGLLKNDAKTLLVALARNMSKIRSTIFLGKEAKDSLGVEYNEEGKYISANDIRTSEGIKKLMSNPDTKIEGEEYFRAVVAANEGKELDDETKITKKFKSGREKTATPKELYEEMKLHLDEYDSLRKAIETYKEVVRVKEQSKKAVRSAWLNRIFGKTKALKEAEKTDNTYTYSGNTMDMMLKLQEGKEPVFNERAVAAMEEQRAERTAEGPEK